MGAAHQEDGALVVTGPNHSLGGSLTRALAELGRASGSSLEAVIHAGCLAVLHRLTGEPDLWIAVADPGSAPNADAVRTSVDANQSFASLVAAAAVARAGPRVHQPPESGLDATALGSSAAPIRRCHVQLSFQWDPERAGGPGPDPLPAADRPALIRILVTGDEEGLVLSLGSDRDVLEASSARALLERLALLLEAAGQQPEQPVWALPIVNDAERHQLLVEWSGTTRPLPPGQCVHHLIEDQARATPTAPAAVCDGRVLSYAELEARSNRLAHRLQQLGVGPDQVVGVCLERSIELPVAVVGILKAGGCYLPLDPTYPSARLSFMLDDAGARVLVSTASLSRAVGPFPGAVVHLDDDDLSALPSTPPATSAAPDDLAYIIYTSGSTGQPKGVMIEHIGVVNLARAVVDLFDITASSRVLQFASFSFDASVTELLVPLTAGATVCLARRDAIALGPSLLETLAAERITTVTLPASLLLVLPDANLPCLETLCAAGEQCPPEVVRRWATDRRFLNGYGPTETTVAVTYERAQRASDGARVPVGRPIDNAEVYILDDHLQPVAPGTIGELYLGGIGLARGYVGRPDLTAARFIAHPFRTVGRLFRSGDRGRFLADGRIECVGRTDDQVKIRGHRVELGEVEHVLGRHPGVAEVVVLARDDHAAGSQLVAYVGRSRDALKRSVELWPSVAEYFVYDDALYHVMSSDQVRNQAYAAALSQVASGRVVLDVGTGPDAVLARLSIEAGARQVYAVDLLEETARRAAATVRELGLDDRIEVIQGDIRDIRLPDLVDVCISEIVGGIGGSEGAAVILNEVRRRHLVPGGCMIPSRAHTAMAAVRVPDDVAAEPRFATAAGHYVESVFQQVGHPFDLRLCITGIGRHDLCSDTGTFEDLDFGREVALEADHAVELTITRSGRVHGLLLWLQLETVAGVTVDTLTTGHCWLPLYLPVFDTGTEMLEGDRLRFTVRRRLATNGLNPDFALEGSQVRTNTVVRRFSWLSGHEPAAHRATPFYDRLFDGGARPNAGDSRLVESELRSHARQFLPEHMVPSRFVFLDQFPTTSSGKVDRSALPAPPPAVPDRDEKLTAPRSPLEEALIEVWRELLEIGDFAVDDNLFDLGADSILMTRAVARIRDRLGVVLPVRAVFESPTVAALARAALDELTLSGDADIDSVLEALGEGRC